MVGKARRVASEGVSANILEDIVTNGAEQPL